MENLSERLFIEVILENDPAGGARSAVELRQGDQRDRTPWVVGDFARESAKHIARKLREKYPSVPQTHIGFIA